ncbi:MAG: hypothetical protein AB7O04_13240 [Hyphomonadaceae bacterium]
MRRSVRNAILAAAGAALLTGCALSDLWGDEARSECDRSATSGPARMDCYDRVERQTREIDRR